MKWMLVVAVFNLAPVKTDLIFNSLDDCLRTEAQMRAEWVRVINSAEPDRRPPASNFLTKQTTYGTCIPHASR